MADKLILNVNLIRNATGFVPRKCAVEKVIEVSHEEFQRFIENPTGRNYYLPQYKDLMGFYDGSFHCVLFVDDKNGDGFLVNSGDYDYARYSQFIPNARGIIQRNEQTPAIDDLKIHMDCCIDRFLKQSKNETEFDIPLTDLIDDGNLAEIFVDYALERLSDDPRIESCELTPNDLEVTKRELVETRFYCPLKIVIDDGSGDCPEEVFSEDYVGYDDEINDFIRADLNRDKGAVERGLAAYLYDENLGKKVYSIMPMVETRNGNLYGMAVVKSYGELNRTEFVDLVSDLTGSLSDGWGEGFEQRPITLGEDEVYISLWNSDDYYLKPESELFREQKLDQTMGGIKMAENITNNENTIVVKFRCPMEFVVAPEDVDEDCFEVTAEHFADHADEINKLIRESFEIDGAEECGLAAYLIDDDLAEKIIGIIPSVENVDGKLCGAITVTSRENLTDIEMGKLKKELLEQLDNGWGMDFTEDTVKVGGEDAYITFLCAKDGEHLHILDADVDIKPTMGGLS